MGELVSTHRGSRARRVSGLVGENASETFFA
jgi:hypothetical protein